VKTVWVQNLPEGSVKDDITSSFKAGTVLRRRLKELLEAKVETEVVSRMKREDYESPSWGFKQADSIGYTRALKEIISLIS
jgi:hypothetical protein